MISGVEESFQQDFARGCREVATERDLFNFHGTFYELPARNAQGFVKIRPIATHNLNIHDYASHFGMLFMTGLNGQANDRAIKSADGTGLLMPCQMFLLKAGTPLQYDAPDGFSAYWVRAVSSAGTVVSVIFKYE